MSPARLSRWLVRAWLLLAAACPTGALAANRAYPDYLPSHGCTRDNNNSDYAWTCPPSYTLADGDTVTLNKSVYITVSGNWTTNRITVNSGGYVGDIQYKVNGTLTLSSGANLTAMLMASAVANPNGNATVNGYIGYSALLFLAIASPVSTTVSLGANTQVSGSVAATGNVSLGQSALVAGNVDVGSGSFSSSYLSKVNGAVTASGPVGINQAVVIGGDVSSSGDAVTTQFQAQLQGNVSGKTGVTLGQSTSVTGSASSSSGPVAVGQQATVAGDVSANTTVTLGQSANVGGNIVSSSNAATGVSVGYSATVGGSVTAAGGVTVAQNALVTSSITNSAGDISLDFGAQVNGNVVSNAGTVTLAQNAVAASCVRASTAGKAITLGLNASAGAVCCGSMGSCTSTCVSKDASNTLPATCSSSLMARWHLDEASWNGSAGELTDSGGFSVGPFNGQAQGGLATPSTTTPARAGAVGTCGYPTVSGAQGDVAPFIVNGLPVSRVSGDSTTVAFWMYWDGGSDDRILSFDTYNLRFSGTSRFGFNTENSDVYGFSVGTANGSVPLSGAWHHIVAVFTNGGVTSNQIYVDGVLQSLSQKTGQPANGNAVTSTTLHIGGSAGSNFRFRGKFDEVQVFNGKLSAAQATALYNDTHNCSGSPHHLELQHASGSGLTCTPSTVTVRACQDSSCSTPYTSGVTGNLTATGTPTVNWPNGQAFSIASGSSSTTVNLQVTSAGSVVLGTSATVPTPTAATSCNFGSPSCTFTAADAGLLFDVPHHRADVSNTVSVTAVKKADGSASCTPAFASVSRSINFKCSYTNPASGNWAVRVGGSALNAVNSATAACDATGRTLGLSFDSTGKASTTVQYADVGQMALTATYTGSAATGDSGLVMSGTDSFIAAPYYFSLTGVSGALVAGNTFSATVSAANYSNTATPNFGRESTPEGVSLGFVRTSPQGRGANNGSFSGSAGSFSNGSATAGNLAWTEVGKGELTALLASGSYLGSGLSAAGATNGYVGCANENGTCSLPTGVTAWVAFGTNGFINSRSGVTGSIACNNATFGDPKPNSAKACAYFVTSGSSSASTGAVGPFKPHHFDVSSSAACGSFSYAGQPFATTVTARNAGGSTTLNYDGSASTTPTYAKATTLSDASALGLGTLSGNSIAAAAYTAGVASATPTYTFSSKTTAPQTLRLRATDTDGVSSAGYTEGSMPLRSGRLRLSNGFGSAKSSLQLAATAEYWSASSWVLNSADSCSSVPAAAVALSNPRSASGSTSTASSSITAAIAIGSGSGRLTLAAPSPAGSTLSLDLALNLGGSTADQSCNSNHPATTGAGLGWLRAQNGNCVSTADRDPGARASFGIYSPETRKTVHVREIY